MAKYRHEFKYVSPEIVLSALKSRVETVLFHDKHTGPSGEYAIRSIYFDDIFNTCFTENEDGTDPRE